MTDRGLLPADQPSSRHPLRDVLHDYAGVIFIILFAALVLMS